MAIEYNFTLDMDRSKRDNNIAYARTGDVDSITINADLVFNGAAYTPTGTNAFFECITPNGHSVRVAAEKTGSSVSVEVPSAAFQAAGVINVAYFRFETGEADNPTYVESTEPFAIVVREGIGDNIDAGDYIEEWRGLADQLEAAVAEVEQKAEQAKTDINEQKTEVDQLKAQAQVSIAQDAEDVSDAKDIAISNINSSQVAVDAAIEQLEQKTQEAVDATQEALDGTLAANLQDAIDRTLKLDVADMVNIPDSSSLSSLADVGSYCCKTAASAATISDSPVDDSPFNMYVFSSATSGQVMQLVVPIDLNSKPTAEWHVRFGTSSAMDRWSVIGGGADIAAGLGIDVTGDAQKTVSLDTTAFYQHHEAADIIQGSTEVTGGGRIKELTIYGNTRQNLWVNPSGTNSGITATANDDGSVTLEGTSTAYAIVDVDSFALRNGGTYTIALDKTLTAPAAFRVRLYDGGTWVTDVVSGATTTAKTFTMPDDDTYDRVRFAVIAPVGTAVSGTYRVMLNEGSEPEPWCPPGLNGVDELSVVCSGKNLAVGSIMTGKNLSTTSGSSYNEATGAIVGFFPVCGGEQYFVSADTGVVSTVAWYADDDEASFISCSPGWNIGDTSVIAPDGARYARIGVSNYDESKVQLELGSTATAYEPPAVTTTPIDLDGHALHSLPDGTRDELRIDGTGAVTLVQRVGVATAPTAASGWMWGSTGSRGSFTLPATSRNKGTWNQNTELLCDKLPPATSVNDASYAVTVGDNGYVKNPAVTSAATAATVAGGATYLYPLAEPQTVRLPSVMLPDLASPGYTVYASSNVTAEIEAEVVKVDYLPPSDVYTKEEVDQKIEDAGGMPDIVPVSQGGTGVTTAAAERNRLGLGNTTGALPVANGGTGASTAKAAEYNILGGMITDGSDPTDASNFAMVRGEPSSEGGVLFKRKGTNVWNWIVSKIRSTFGFNTSNVLGVDHGGTGATSAASARTNLSVYSKAEVDGKVPKVVYGTGNIPGDAANGTIYIQYRS